MTILDMPSAGFLAITLYTAVYVACVVSPPLLATAVAVRRGPQMRRRLLFVVTVTMIAYGVTLSILFVVGIPLAVFLVYVVPTLPQTGYLEQSMSALAAFLVTWSIVWIPLVFPITVLCVLRYIATRWNNIEGALGSVDTDRFRLAASRRARHQW